MPISQQGESFTSQLEFGIRYFDMDTCWNEVEAACCHCRGSSCAYTSSVMTALKQIDSWMKSHPNEVIFIHFNRDVQEGYNKEIATSLQSSL